MMCPMCEAEFSDELGLQSHVITKHLNKGSGKIADDDVDKVCFCGEYQIMKLDTHHFEVEGGLVAHWLKCGLGIGDY